MTVMYCENCKENVESEYAYEFQGEPGHGGFVQYERCPNCLQDDLLDVKLCEMCREPHHEIGQDYCAGCREFVADVMREAFNRIQDERNASDADAFQAIDEWLEVNS